MQANKERKNKKMFRDVLILFHLYRDSNNIDHFKMLKP